MELPTRKQLDELAKNLLPLFRKLAGAQPSQVLRLTLTAIPVDEAVQLRLSLKLDGVDLPQEQEQKIDLFLQKVWEKYQAEPPVDF